MESAPLPQKLAAGDGRGWIVEHDERRSFFLPYLALSVTCSVFVSLFWLVVLVGIHLGIELERARRQNARPPLGRALWEIKLDLGLLLLALSMAVYMDVAFGILGLGASVRGGATAARIGARAHLVRRAIRGVLLVLDDIVRVLGVIIATRGIQKAATAPPTAPPWRGRWGWGDRIALSLLAASTLLLLFSPWLSGHDLGAIVEILLGELRPWPTERL